MVLDGLRVLGRPTVLYRSFCEKVEGKNRFNFIITR